MAALHLSNFQSKGEVMLIIESGSNQKAFLPLQLIDNVIVDIEAVREFPKTW